MPHAFPPRRCSDLAGALIELTRELADGELAPRVDDFEARGEFPREVLRTLGRAGLMGLPYPEEFGGGGQPYEVYLQVLEELAGRWLARSEEHTSELQSLMRTSYAVFCLKKK